MTPCGRTLPSNVYRFLLDQAHIASTSPAMVLAGCRRILEFASTQFPAQLLVRDCRVWCWLAVAFWDGGDGGSGLLDQVHTVRGGRHEISAPSRAVELRCGGHKGGSKQSSLFVGGDT